MNTLQEIKEAIWRLTDDDIRARGEWLDELEEVIWDAKIERDAASGKRDQLVQEAREDYRAGRCTDF